MNKRYYLILIVLLLSLCELSYATGKYLQAQWNGGVVMLNLISGVITQCNTAHYSDQYIPQCKNIGAAPKSKLLGNAQLSIVGGQFDPKFAVITNLLTGTVTQCLIQGDPSLYGVECVNESAL
ncbi:MAG: hypothetical protein NTY69_07075 [Methylococcales bacterium]|nr:hypothetical protein [Methylococcales bacterium]